ncbi:helix-turn-helix domain-containing protein [Enterococcus sp. DIV0125]|uniref:helix-turn-helix domain-containing protein n=1 Tax=Enterococcus sp. DIV0125 TaxID=2774796 RepID=UPI003D2FD8E1
MNHLVDGMFETLFFESNSRNKLHLFKYLIVQEQKVSLKSVAKQFNLSYQGIQTLTKEIIQDELQEHGQSQFILKTGKVLREQEVQLFTIDSYRLFLLKKKSVTFTYLVYKVRHPNKNELSYAQKHLISISTFHRKIQLLKNLLAVYQMNLTLKTTNDLQETAYRIFLYFSLWWGYRGQENLFTCLGNEKKYQVIANQDSSFITKQQLVLLLNVLESRYLLKKYLTNFELQDGLHTLFYDYGAPYAELWHHTPKKVRSAEKKFLSTFINLFILNERIATEQKRVFARQQLKQNKQLAEFVKTYLRLLEKNQFEIISDSEFVYDVLLFSGMVNNLIGEEAKEIIQLIQQLLPASYQKTLVALKGKVIEQEELQVATKSRPLLVLCVLLTLHYRKYRVPSVTVGLPKELGIICIKDLQSFLGSFGFVKVIILEDISTNSCDLLLINYSLMKQKVPKKQRYYYWDQSNFPENYTALERKIFEEKNRRTTENH